MPDITSIFARTIYNSRGSKTIETDVTVQGGYTGRVCAPSGASVGKYEAVAFPDGGPEKCVQILADNTSKFSGVDAANAERVYKALRAIDSTPDYSIIGGATAFAVSIAAAEAAAKECKVPLFEFLSNGNEYYFPYPLGNILGGGAHAGPGTPDIQEILVCATGAKTVHDAIATNFAVHKELGELLKKSDASFTNGRGDEGGWAPKMDNQAALEISAKACENLGFTLGKEVSLGVDFASSTQWNGSKYAYERAGFENDSGQQVDFVSEIIEKFKLRYAEDAVHEEAFSDMAELTSKFRAWEFSTSCSCCNSVWFVTIHKIYISAHTGYFFCLHYLAHHATCNVCLYGKNLCTAFACIAYQFTICEVFKETIHVCGKYTHFRF